MLKFRCTHCSCPLRATAEVVGTWTACPSCGRRILVPKQPDAAPVGRVDPARVSSARVSPAHVAATRFDQRAESSASSGSQEPARSAHDARAALGRHTVIGAVALLAVYLLYSSIGYFGVYEVHQTFFAFGIFAWVVVGIGFGYYRQCAFGEHPSVDAGDVDEEVPRIASFVYLGLTGLAIFIAGVIPYEVRHPQARVARRPIDSRPMTFYPHGISKSEWDDLERRHGANTVHRILIRDLPPDDKELKKRIVDEFVAVKSWNVYHELDSTTIELVVPRRFESSDGEREKFTRLVGVEEGTRTTVFVFDREKTERLLTAEREKAANEKFAQTCMIPDNADTVRYVLERHPRDKIVFVEIENLLTSDEQRSQMSENVGSGRCFGTVKKSSDGRFFEAVYAPIDDIDAFAKGFSEFKLLGVDPTRQRITLRPDPKLLQEQIEFSKDNQELYRLWSDSYGRQQIRERMHDSEEREHFLVVNVYHSDSGVGGRSIAVYRGLRARGPVLAMSSHAHGTQQYLVKYDDFYQFVEKIDFGTIVGIEPSQRSVTVDLDVEHAKPIDWKNWKPGDYAVFEDEELRHFERDEIQARYGAQRVVEITVNGLPDDPAERELVHKVLRDGKRTFRVFGKRQYQYQYFLVAPVDDFQSYVRKFDFARTSFRSSNEREIHLDIGVDRVRKRMMGAAEVEARSAAPDVVAEDIETLESDLLALRKKYGRARVVQMRADDMPDDPVEREFVRNLIRDGRETVRIYVTGTTEHYLIAPVDDDDSYNLKLIYIKRGGSASNNEHKYSILVDIAGVRREMKKATK